MIPQTSLLQAFQLTPNLSLKNRIVMAPLTRSMANTDHTPTLTMAEYYARRAEAGLIISEGTIIRPDGLGYPRIPGIYTQAQIKGWRQVTDAVHEKGGRIFMQIWHVGRVSHPSFLNGQLPLAPSSTQMSGRVWRSPGLSYGKSRAVSQTEIQELVLSFKQAAINAVQAGCDGVEIHGANGYLVDQFLHYATNQRLDDYGGSPENMARFALEVVKACGESIGYEKVGLRLSPGAYVNGMTGDARDNAVFGHLLSQLNTLPIAYIHTGNFDDKVIFAELDNLGMTEFLRRHYQGILIASGSYNFYEAAQGIENRQFDLIAMGRSFIANPDLIERFQTDQPLLGYDVRMLETLY